jgi:hypothetical protein
MLVKAANAMMSLIKNDIEWKILDLTKRGVNNSKNRR